MNLNSTICFCCLKNLSNSLEHVIPEALGGNRRLGIKICNICNNQTLSVLDDYLVTNTIFALAKAVTLQKGYYVQKLWNLDTIEGSNTLIESGFDKDTNSARIYPQLIVKDNIGEIRADSNLIQYLGREDFHQYMRRSILNAYHQFESGSGDSKYLRFETLEQGQFPHRYDYPPRLFVRKPLKTDGQNTWILKYADPSDKRNTLNYLSKWRSFSSLRKYTSTKVSKHSSFYLEASNYEIAKALIKIGINLVRYCASNTNINAKTVPDIAVVLGKKKDNSIINRSGICINSAYDSKVSNRSSVCHELLVSHIDGKWIINGSYYGDRVITYTEIYGPCYESWRTYRIILDLNSGKVLIKEKLMVYSVNLDNKHKICWDDPASTAPWLDLSENKVGEVLRANFTHGQRKYKFSV